MVGGYAFLGGGVYHATASPVVETASTASEFGAGSVAFIGGGIGTFISCPVVDMAGIGLGFFAGEYIYVGSEWLGLWWFWVLWDGCAAAAGARIPLHWRRCSPAHSPPTAPAPPQKTEGFLVWLFSPTTVFSAIDYFDGWGGFIFVGVGAAMMGFSPTYQQYFITDEAFDYWVMVRANGCPPSL